MTTATSAPRTTLGTHASDVAAVTHAYERWADLVLAKTAPDASWDHVDLSDYLAGPLLLHITKLHAERAATGEVLRLPTRPASRNSVLDATVHGDVATVESCEVDDAIVESKDGVVINDRVMTFHDRVELHLTASARDMLGKLSRAHLQELEVMEPALTRALGRFGRARRGT